MNVLLGFCEITGYYGSLKRYLLLNGYKCQHYLYVHNKYSFHSNYSRNVFAYVIRLCMSIRVFIKSRTSSKLLRILIDLCVLPITVCLRVILFLFFLCKYDYYVLGFKSGFILPNYNNIVGRWIREFELFMLKFFKKRTIFIFHGSDIRPPFLDPLHVHLDEKIIRRLSRYMRQDLRVIEKYADAIIAPHGCAQFLTRIFINWSAIGQIINFTDSDLEKRSRDEESHVKILHVPSDRNIKGSNNIRAVIENIRDRGFGIEYTEVTEVTHKEVIEEIQKSDIVIDQLYSDMPTTVFSMEAGLLGKIVVMGGYEIKEISELIPLRYRVPFVYIAPNEMEETIIKLVLDKNMIIERGKVIKDKIESEYNNNVIANKLIAILLGEIDKDWLISPNKISFSHGSGLSVNQVVKNLEVYKDLL